MFGTRLVESFADSLAFLDSLTGGGFFRNAGGKTEHSTRFPLSQDEITHQGETKRGIASSRSAASLKEKERRYKKDVRTKSAHGEGRLSFTHLISHSD